MVRLRDQTQITDRSEKLVVGQIDGAVTRVPLGTVRPVGFTNQVCSNIYVVNVLTAEVSNRKRLTVICETKQNETK